MLITCFPFPAAIAITLRRPWSPAIRGNRRSGTYLGPPAVTLQWYGRRMTPIPPVNSSTRVLAPPCKRLRKWDPCSVLRRTQATEKHAGLRENPPIGVADHLGDPHIRLLEVDVDTTAYQPGHAAAAWRLGEALLYGPDGELGTTSQASLGQQVADVRFSRPLADRQPFGDLAVRTTRHDQPGHLTFAYRQRQAR